MQFYQHLKLVLLFIISNLFGKIRGQLNGTCDFDNRNGLCGYHQATGSDSFDWSIEESNSEGYYLAIQTENYLVGETALLWGPEIQLQETHCFSFDYYLGYSGTNNSTQPIVSGQINVHIVDPEISDINQPVWTSTGLYQHKWNTVHLALNPNTYQVAFEGVILEQVEGMIAIDNVNVNAAACDSTPHFLRVSAKEVNINESETLTCILFGHTSPNIHVFMQKSTGELFSPTSTTDYGDHFSADFRFSNVAVKNGGLYRCVSSEKFQSGVSNFAALSVKIPPTPKRSPDIIQPGSTSFLIRLNADEYTGDGPISQKILQYRPIDGAWSDVHHITTDEYRLWNLQPDTKYELSLTLVRRGQGGTGSPGPKLVTKTKCGVPLASVQNVRFKNGPGRVKLIWDVPSFKVTRCHFIEYLVKYHVYMPNQNNTAANSAENKIKTIDRQGVNTTVLRGLLPYTRYSIKLQLKNQAGSRETGWYTVQTEEEAPGPIPPNSLLVKFVNSTKIVLTWDKPNQLNGMLKGYEVVYKGIKSYDPNYIAENSDGYMETQHQNVTIDVHSGTTYEISVKALNGAGLGQESSIIVTSDIEAPSLQYPPPSSNKNDENPTTIAIQLIPADNNGAPVTRYYVIVEEVKPVNYIQPSQESNRKKSSKNGKKNKKRRNNRSLDSLTRVRRQTIGHFTEENPCYEEPVTYEDAKNSNGSAYASAQFSPSEIAEERTFVVGDGSSYNGFENPPLDPNKEYNVYVRAESTVNGETKISCVLVAQKEKMPFVDTTPSHDQNSDVPNSADGKTTDTGVKEKQEQDVILYASVGGAVIGIIVISLIIIILVVRMKRRKKEAHKDEVVNPFEVRLMLTDRSGTPHSLQTKLNGDSPDRQQLMPDLVGYEQQDCMEKTSEHSGQQGYGSTSERFAIRVDDFHVHVSQMKATGGFGFREEYASIPNNSNVPCAVANSPQNKDKNRYGNILAYDHSRVILEPPPGHEEEFESDYINASYINGYKNPSMFIASQAPTAGTTHDFWWMVWQEKTNIIVMVTNLVEQGKQKCFKYWPDDRSTYGTVQVVFSTEENVCDYCVRTFMLQQSDGYDAREVKIFHFTAWPDHGVPSRPTNLLSFVRRVKAYEPAGQGPTIVHCSAGSGRTGCYIVISMMLEMARDEEIVDIYNTVCDLRSRRINMVQTEEQYVFIHEAILEALLCGETSVSAEMLMQHYDDLITVDQHSNFAPIQEEFETLNVITPKLSEEECSVARLPRNRASNRFMDVLPADRYLAYLLTPDPSDRDNNYINAIYLDSYSIKNSFLVTQMPLPSTVIDIWRLVYDHNCTSIVMMNDVTEHDHTCCQYWPDSGTAIYGLFTVELLTKDEEVDVTSRMFKITNTSRPNDGYRIIQQFQLTNWPATQPVPFSRNAVLRIIQLTTKWQDECAKLGDAGRTMVHCVAGAGRSGTFVACHNMCQQLRQEYSVDVFNIVQRLRNIRPQLVETLEQYRFCYEVGIEYADH